MLKLAIVGSHNLLRSQYEAAEILVEGIIHHYAADYGKGGVRLLSGGAKGVDTIAKLASDSLLGPTPEIYLPEQPRWEPRGYKARNLEIAKACDILWALCAWDSKTGGAVFTANMAEQHGKEVHRLWL